MGLELDDSRVRYMWPKFSVEDRVKNEEGFSDRGERLERLIYKKKNGVVFVFSRRKLADKRISRSPNSVQGRVWDFDGILLGGSTETVKIRPGADAFLHELNQRQG